MNLIYSDDVCILSASGTAAVVVSGNLTAVDLLNISSKAGGRDISDMLKERNNASGRTDSLSSQPNVRQSYRMTKLLSANRRLVTASRFVSFFNFIFLDFSACFLSACL